MTDDSISLREYVDSQFISQKEAVKAAFDAQKEAIAAALAAAKEAVGKAEAAVEKRFENTNEWRNTVETLQRTYTPRTEVNQVMTSMTEKMEVLQKLVWVGFGIMLALQFFVGIALVFWKKQ
jgi:hypothetical protein